MDFNEFINCEYKRIEEKWDAEESYSELSLAKIDNSSKKNREKALDKWMDKAILMIRSFPDDIELNLHWKDALLKLIEKMITEDIIFALEIPKDLRDHFIKATIKFFKMAREYDENLPLDDIGQALRNVWIVSILQSLMGRELRLTDSIFSYSMLYPYTDNFLDDVEIPMKEKENFNKRLSLRLKGHDVPPLNEYEKKAYPLIKKIENEFDRRIYKDVYLSLIEIHEGQIMSLTQQDKKAFSDERDILRISIKKGGASVLADGFIIDGSLTKEEIEFCIRFGTILQMADDIQDLKEDIRNNHHTIMSEIARCSKLDKVINKLLNFTAETVDSFNSPSHDDKLIKNLIKDNTMMLILFSVILNPRHFSYEYAKKAESFLPFTRKYTQNLKKNLHKKLSVLDDMKQDGRLDKALDVLIS